MVIWQVFTLRLDRGVTSICLHNKRRAKGALICIREWSHRAGDLPSTSRQKCQKHM